MELFKIEICFIPWFLYDLADLSYVNNYFINTMYMYCI